MATAETTTQPMTPAAGSTQDESVLETLLSEGLLTDDAASGKPATLPKLGGAHDILVDVPRPWPRLWQA